MPKREWIDEDVVDRAFAEEGGGKPQPSPKREAEGPKVLLWALGIVGTAAIGLGAAQFTDLKTEFRTHVGAEERKHEELRQVVDEIKDDLKDEKRARAWRDRLLQAMAKKLRVEVSEVQEGGQK